MGHDPDTHGSPSRVATASINAIGMPEVGLCVVMRLLIDCKLFVGNGLRLVHVSLAGS